MSKGIIIVPQGDCVLKRCGPYEKYFGQSNVLKIPKDAVKQDTVLVLKGDNNSHALAGGNFEILKDQKRTYVRVLSSGVFLSHVTDLSSMKMAEHFEKEIPVGDWFYQPLQEFDHILNEQRTIID